MLRGSTCSNNIRSWSVCVDESGVEYEVCMLFSMHYQLTSRTLTTADLTVERVHRYSQYKDAEEEYKMVIKVLKLVRPERIRDFIDDWPRYLALYNGQNGRPLDYMIQANVMMPAEATDPSFGEPGSLYGSYMMR
jgi:hypothetical protein